MIWINPAKRPLVYSLLLSNLFAASYSYAAVHIVTNTNATGAGSLDEAVRLANADISGPIQIGFSLAPNSTITLSNALFLQKNMLLSTSTTTNVVIGASGASNLTIVNTSGAALLAGVTSLNPVNPVLITIDGNNGTNGLSITT